MVSVNLIDMRSSQGKIGTWWRQVWREAQDSPMIETNITEDLEYCDLTDAGYARANKYSDYTQHKLNLLESELS